MRTCFLGIAITMLVPLSVFAYIFPRDLSVGSTGEDVRELQKALNADSRTQVAVLGAGSSGQETAYFGALTVEAVRKYQELHAVEILVPVGLSRGTGFFGPSTRAHLQNTLAAQQSTEGRPQLVFPSIYRIEPSRGPAGTEVTIHGIGFEEENQVSSQYERWADVVSEDGETLQITVNGPFPEGYLEKYLDKYKEYSGDVGAGIEYKIKVTTSDGESNESIFFLSF